MPRITAHIVAVGVAAAALVLTACGSTGADLEPITLQDAAAATAEDVNNHTSASTARPADAGREGNAAAGSPGEHAPSAGGELAARAERTALEAVGSGTVLYVERDEEDGRETFEVHVEDRDGVWWEVTVDAATGRAEEVDRDDDPEPASDPAIDEVSARAAASRAADSDDVLGARLVTDDDGGHWDVRVRDGDGRILEVAVDAGTGDVVEVEIED